VFCCTPSNTQCASFADTYGTTLLTLVHALVVTKVDYCNSVLSGISGQLLQRLQSVFNAAARLVFSVWKSDHITPLLRELHWLKVPERIQFRLCVLAYCCLNGTAPSYLAETLHLTVDVGSLRRLRGASTSTLVVPSTRHTTLGDRMTGTWCIITKSLAVPLSTDVKRCACT